MTDQLPDEPTAEEIAEADTVVFAYVHDVELPFSFFYCLRRLTAFDIRGYQRMIRAGEMGARYGTGGIVSARNKTITQFLASPHPWLLWMDTDMGYPPDIIERLIEAADPVERPIMGGLCFASREIEPDGMGGFHTFPVPTIFDWHVNPDGTCGFLPRRNYERDAVIQVSGTGSACILIHRSVFEKIREAEGDHWYDPMTVVETGAELSEDLSFCARATRYGFPIHINTAAKTTHYKPIWLGELHYDLYRKALGEDSVIELAAVGYDPTAVMPDGTVVRPKVDGDLVEVEAPPANRAERRARRRRKVKS